MSTLVAQTISNGTVSTSTANCIQGSAKAWVCFNGSTAAIRGSYNVSSITKHTTGDYTVNFTNALADTNFDVNGTCSGISANCPIVFDNSVARARTTSSVSVRTMDINAFGDPLFVSTTVFR
jgi:hypothetical protein